jgi:hypothetical protein
MNFRKLIDRKPDVPDAPDVRGGIFKARLNATRKAGKARAVAARATASRPKVVFNTDSKKAIGAAGILGAASAFFFDPKSGTSRRESLRRLIQRDSDRPEEEIAMAPSATPAASNGGVTPETRVSS